MMPCVCRETLYSTERWILGSKFQFNAVLKSVMKFVATNIENVKSHSFRIGGATNAMYKDIPYESIKAMGRWKSEAAQKYIRIPIFDVNDLT
jgi:hypothetical protein